MRKGRKRRGGRYSRIRTITPKKGVNLAELQRALKRSGHFARITPQGKIVTNAPSE